MKIEIDLDDILGDEDGSESLSDSVRRQVIEKLTETTAKGVKDKINSEVCRVIDETLKESVATQMPALVADLMNAKYKPVDQWGTKSPETTFRDELIRSIAGQMLYKSGSYESDKNAFTKAVDSVIAAKVAEFKSAFNTQVDATFIQEAMAYATSKLAERLGVKK